MPREAPANVDGGSARAEDDLQEGDVLVANYICAYEYQALKIVARKVKPEHDAREVPVSLSLLGIAQALIGAGWSYPSDLPKTWEKRRRPKALEGGFASGCKLLRTGAKWFEDLRAAVGKRKILAGEMEGEGVGETVRTYAPAPEFLLIKGISDFGDPGKGDEYNDFASRTAAQFLRNLMSHRDFVALLQKL